MPIRNSRQTKCPSCWPIAPSTTLGPSRPEGAVIDAEAVSRFVVSVRETTDRYTGVGDDVVLHEYNVVAPDDQTRLTWAGMLTLGQNPAAYSPGARVSYMRLPRAGDPEDVRSRSSRKLDGTVGQLLDATLQALARDLDHIQRFTRATCSKNSTYREKHYVRLFPTCSYTEAS